MAKAKLHDVAAAAGVSLASASRALSGGSASPQMVSRVREAARDLNYLADSTARSLRRGSTRRVAFAVDDIGNPNYVAMLRAIESRFGPDGPHVSVSSTRDASRTAEWVKQLAFGATDGLIICPIRSDDRLRRVIANSAIPVVIIGSLGDEVNVDVDNVRVDSSIGVELATAHLISLGRRSIAFVNGPLDTRPGVMRERGFFRAVRKLGVPEREVRQVVAEEFTVEAGRNAAFGLFQNWHSKPSFSRVSAVVAANDLIALGVIVAATSAGLRVPQDIAVTGVDDTEFAAVYNPSLTSVSLFAARRGEIAADLLMQRFEAPNRPTRTINVEPQLVVRDSTARAGVERRVG